MEKNLEEYLTKKIFEDREPSESVSNAAGLYTVLASINRSMARKEGWKSRLEDFAIDEIPDSVKEDNLREYVREFYKSLGYKEYSLKHLGPHMNFIKEDQKIGVNLSYSPTRRTCLVTVLDMG